MHFLVWCDLTHRKKRKSPCSKAVIQNAQTMSWHACAPMLVGHQVMRSAKGADSARHNQQPMGGTANTPPPGEGLSYSLYSIQEVLPSGKLRNLLWELTGETEFVPGLHHA